MILNLCFLCFLWRRKSILLRIVLNNTAVGKIIIQLSYLIQHQQGYLRGEFVDSDFLYYSSVLKLIQVFGGVRPSFSTIKGGLYESCF